MRGLWTMRWKWTMEMMSRGGGVDEGVISEGREIELYM
jgi:hypothetical protein